MTTINFGYQFFWQTHIKPLMPRNESNRFRQWKTHSGFAMLCSHSWADAPWVSQNVCEESFDGFNLESHLEHLISVVSGIGCRSIWWYGSGWLKHQGYVDLSWPVSISTPPSISAVFWRYSFQTAIQNGPPRVSRVPLVLSSEIGQMGYWKQ